MADPTITYIKPNEVKQSTAVTIKIWGSNFNNESFVFIDDANPIQKYVSSVELEAALSKEDTKKAGRKAVKVHNINDGTLSNEVTLTIV